MNYKISIIIPTFNAEDSILKSVKSIQNQTIGFENIELIISDDKSNDSTQYMLKKLSTQYPNIKAIFGEENSGTPSRPRNRGIELATGKYIMFLDADDEYEKDMCEKMYNAIETYNVDSVACKYSYITETDIEKPHSFLDNYPENPIFESIEKNPELMSMGVPSMIWNKLFKTEIIKNKNIRCLDGISYEDPAFNVDYYLNSDKSIVLNNYYGYRYNRIENKDSISQCFSQKMLLNHTLGFLKIMETLNNQKINYNFMKSEIIVDLTKIYVNAKIDTECEKKFLKVMKPFYKEYKLTQRIHTANFAFNMIINLFIKLFGINDKIAIFTSKVFKKIKS